MRIRREILSKYLESAAKEQIIEDYVEKGYKKIDLASDFGDEPDLVMEKGDDKIIFEIKSSKWEREKQTSVVSMRNFFVHKYGASFKLVSVQIPDQPDIILDGIESSLEDLIISNFESEFNNIATHYWIDEISDLDYSFLLFKNKAFDLQGDGIISVCFQYGSDGDYQRGDGIQFYKSYVFKFNLTLDTSLNLIEQKELLIDFYNDD